MRASISIFVSILYVVAFCLLGSKLIFASKFPSYTELNSTHHHNHSQNESEKEEGDNCRQSYDTCVLDVLSPSQMLTQIDQSKGFMRCTADYYECKMKIEHPAETETASNQTILEPVSPDRL